MTAKKSETSPSPVPGPVHEAVKHIFNLGAVEERFRTDVTKFVTDAYAAGAESGATIHEASDPLAHHEVSAVRDAARSLPEIANSLAALIGAFKK